MKHTPLSPDPVDQGLFRRDHPDTSRAAAHSVPNLSGKRLAVLRVIVASGGCTDEHVQDATGLGPNTARPRRVELVDAGLVEDGGARVKLKSGSSAIVWVATARGRGVVEEVSNGFGR